MRIKALALFIALHATVVTTLLYAQRPATALNLELAYFSALLIMYASYQGYKKMVSHSVQNGITLDLKDPIEKIDDPYDLYDEEAPNDEIVDIKELKKEIKKDGFKKMIKTAAGHTSWKRLASYFVLILVFMALNNNHILEIGSFLTGLTLGIITAAVWGPKIIGHATK